MIKFSIKLQFRVGEGEGICMLKGQVHCYGCEEGEELKSTNV